MFQEIVIDQDVNNASNKFKKKALLLPTILGIPHKAPLRVLLRVHVENH